MSAKNSAEGAQKIVEIGSNSATRVNAQRPVLSHNAQRPKVSGPKKIMQPGVYRGRGCVASRSLQL